MSSEPSPQGASAAPRVQFIGITGIPEIGPGNELGPIILAAAAAQGTAIENGDVVVVTQKIVSKAEGRTVNLSDVIPSPFACRLAKEMDRDGRLVELVLRESRSIVRMDVARGIIITETRHGFICANAGIDASNVPGDQRVCLLPEDPDRSAARIRDYILSTPGGGRVAAIISDTFGRTWREGQVNFAVGVAGMSPMRDYRGTLDAHGKVLKVTNIAVADELAAAAELVMAKAAGVPVALVRGFAYPEAYGGVQGLIRHRSRDLFR